MALISCPECKKQVSSLAPACPHCGFPEPAKHQKNQRSMQDLLHRHLEVKQKLLDMRERFIARFPKRPRPGYDELNSFIQSLLEFSKAIDIRVGSLRGMIQSGKSLSPDGFNLLSKEIESFLRSAEVGEMTYRNFTPKYTLIDPTKKKDWL